MVETNLVIKRSYCSRINRTIPDLYSRYGMTNDNNDKPTEKEKRRVYVLFFCMAFFIDLAVSTFRGEMYHPTLVGLSVMIGSLLFFLWSLWRHR